MNSASSFGHALNAWIRNGSVWPIPPRAFGEIGVDPLEFDTRYGLYVSLQGKR